MKYIVLKNTYDRETKKPIKKGDVIALSKKRAERGVKLGLIEVLETEKKVAKPKEAEKKEDKKLDPKLETK